MEKITIFSNFTAIRGDVLMITLNRCVHLYLPLVNQPSDFATVLKRISSLYPLYR